MLEFQTTPDPIFLAILDAALEHARNDLYPFLETAQPSQEDLAEQDEFYRDLYPDLARLFTREEALAVVDRLTAALHEETLYRATDFHWLVLHGCLLVFCELHNDDALGRDGKVGPYTIDEIDFDSILSAFFFDIDFLFHGELIVSSEHGERTPPGITEQSWKIAGGVKPGAADLALTAITLEDSWSEPAADKPVPLSGYVGPYPMRAAAEPPSND